MTQQTTTTPAPVDCRRELGNIALCTEGRHGADTCPHFRGDVGEIGCQFIGTRVVDKGAWMVTSSCGRNTNIHLYTCNRPTADAPTAQASKAGEPFYGEWLKKWIEGVGVALFARAYRLLTQTEKARVGHVVAIMSTLSDDAQYLVEALIESNAHRPYLCKLKPEPKGETD